MVFFDAYHKSPTVFACTDCGVFIDEDEFSDMEDDSCKNCESGIMMAVRFIAEADIEDVFESIKEAKEGKSKNKEENKEGSDE